MTCLVILQVQTEFDLRIGKYLILLYSLMNTSYPVLKRKSLRNSFDRVYCQYKKGDSDKVREDRSRLENQGKFFKTCIVTTISLNTV